MTYIDPTAKLLYHIDRLADIADGRQPPPVNVEIDRYTRDSYRAYKRTDAFDRAVLGIRHLVRATGQATVGVGFLLDATYWEDAQDMAEMALDLGADYVQFRPMIGPDAGWIETARPMLIWLAQQKGVILDLSRFYLYRAWAGHGYPRCHWTQLQTVITPDARVWTCVNRRGFDGDCLGDLTTEPFEMIWRRSGAKLVDGRCRVMCRGHIANLTLDKVMGEQPEHGGFI